MKYDGPQKLINSNEANNPNEMANTSKRRVNSEPTKCSALSETKIMTRQDILLFQAPVYNTDRRNAGVPHKSAAICGTTAMTAQDIEISKTVKKKTF